MVRGVLRDASRMARAQGCAARQGRARNSMAVAQGNCAKAMRLKILVSRGCISLIWTLQLKVTIPRVTTFGNLWSSADWVSHPTPRHYTLRCGQASRLQNLFFGILDSIRTPHPSLVDSVRLWVCYDQCTSSCCKDSRKNGAPPLQWQHRGSVQRRFEVERHRSAWHQVLRRTFQGPSVAVD